MPDLREQHSILTDLRSFPELARAIGVYTAKFGAVELILWQVFAAVIQIEEGDAMSLLGSIQSFTSRMDCLENFFLNTRNDMECNFLVSKIIKSARGINSFRNKLAHGVYQTNSKQEKVYVLAFGTDPKRQSSGPGTTLTETTNFFELTETRINEEIDKINILHQDIYKLSSALRPHVLSSASHGK